VIRRSRGSVEATPIYIWERATEKPLGGSKLEGLSLSSFRRGLGKKEIEAWSLRGIFSRGDDPLQGKATFLSWLSPETVGERGTNCWTKKDGGNTGA